MRKCDYMILSLLINLKTYLEVVNVVSTGLVLCDLPEAVNLRCSFPSTAAVAVWADAFTNTLSTVKERTKGWTHTKDSLPFGVEYHLP